MSHPTSEPTTGPDPATAGLRRFEVELMAHVYVTVPVFVAGEELAAGAADAALPRWPVVVTLADGCPAEAAVTREQDLGGQLRHRPQRRDGLALSVASRWPAAG